MEKQSLQEMVQTLISIDDITWGMYAFSRDVLRGRVDSQTKKIMIEKAICCGYTKADQVIKQFGCRKPEQIAQKLHLKVELLDKGLIADRILFALFTPPDRIQIMEEPLKKAAACPEIAAILPEAELRSLILGHEIFHFLEEEDETIYTRKEKISLWKLFGYTNRSTIRALSEIAGMSFTKRLNAFPYSPFALDVILYYNYNTDESEKIYRDVLACRQEDL